MSEFVRQFAFGGLISLGIGSAKAKDAIYVSVDALPPIPEDRDVFFSPAMRKTPGDTKEDVLGTVALWADVDNENKPRWTLPPTYVVFSGHGWHCYWFLKSPCFDLNDIEECNRILADDVDGDRGCWNANRVLRVPGTTNNKQPDKPIKVNIRVQNSVSYTLDEIKLIQNIPNNVKHKIATGDSRGHRTRSERDWSIVSALVRVGAEDALIYRIFENQPCGDKHVESGSDTYLEHTIEKIREKAPRGRAGKNEDASEVGAIVEGDDGFYIQQKKGMRRISTFLLHPKLLLDGSAFENEDALVCDVLSDTYSWPDITFNRSAFNSNSKMDQSTPVAAWQWLGREDDLRKLLPYLLERLKEQGLPRVAATKTLGLHNINGHWLFLGDKQAISKTDVWQGFEGPLAWLPSKTEHPALCLEVERTHDPRVLGELIPQLNEEQAIWPMIGWYTATVMKPWIEQHKLRFPILNVAGTRGSGKTSLIQRVFMPLWGQEDPVSYDSGTTKFVTLALLGASNAVPIAFSEFRVDAVQRFLRFVLLAYDTGHDPRGRADQTTVDYLLQAPFSLDGEDLIDDAAARERIVVAKLHPGAIEEGSPSYNAFKEMQNVLDGVPQMAGTLIQRILELEREWDRMLQEAKNAVYVAFPGKLPDRVRNNHIVAYFGMMLWCNITESKLPEPAVLEQSINTVYDMKIGRSRTLCDDMIEHIVNTASSGTARYKYTFVDGIFWFQMTPAYDDWVASRRRQGRGTLERDAMKTQLSEATYQVEPQVVDAVWMHGINLTKAFDSGLDVPQQMIVFKFQGRSF